MVYQYGNFSWDLAGGQNVGPVCGTFGTHNCLQEGTRSCFSLAFYSLTTYSITTRQGREKTPSPEVFLQHVLKCGN